jgi:Mrp family chromosome partitioning ATPase
VSFLDYFELIKYYYNRLKLIQQIKPDGAILVTTPQKLSMDAVRKEITFCRKMKLKIIGLIENMAYFVCPCCNVSFPSYLIKFEISILYLL